MTATRQVIPLDEVRPGMVLAENVLLSGDRVLLPKATTLNEAHIANLRQRDVREIAIEPIAAPAPAATSDAERNALREAARNEVQLMFRRSGNDPVNLALAKAILEYRLEKIG